MSDDPAIDQVISTVPDANDFETPSDATIDAVLLRIGEPQLRRALFSQLENPNWLRALVERDAVGTPQVTEGVEGRRLHLPWPEGDYLVRMVKYVPHEVVEVLERIADTQNWIAQGVIVSATAALPPDLAARLAPALRRFVEPGSSHDPEEVTNAALNVLESGDWPVARALLRTIFEPRVTGEQDGPLGPRPQVAAGIDDYWFGETIPRVAALLTERHRQEGVRALVTWLELWQKLTERYISETGRDISSVWRPSIAPHEQNGGFEELGDPLVDAVRDSVVRLSGLEGPFAGVRPLIDSPQPLLQRIGMHAVATAAADRSREIGTPDLVALGLGWLEDPTYLDYVYRVEYSHLLGVLAKHLSQDDLDRWIAMTREHEFAPRELIAKVLADDTRPPSDISDIEIERYRDGCRRDLLASIRSDVLPDELIEYRDELVRAHGEAREHVEFSSWSQSFVGPTSPLPSDEFKALSIADLVAFLSTWNPPRDRGFGPSAEGVGRQVTDRAQTEPQGFASEARRFIGLEATYVRSVLQGLDRALQDEQPEIDWDAVLALCEHVVAQPRGLEDVTFDLDRDKNWIWARAAVASLLATAAGTKTLALQLGHRTLDVLAALANDPQPTKEYEAKYGGENMDPLTLSLNTVRPVAIRAVVRFHLANSALAKPMQAIRDGTLSILDAHLGTDSDPSLAVQAVLGEHLGRLLGESAADWLGDRVRRLLGEPATPLATVQTPGPDTVWSTMLATYHPGAWMVATLRNFVVQRIGAVGSGRAEVIGWRQQRTPNQLLGDWLATLFVRGEIDGPSERDGLLSLYFEAAEPTLCADVLERLGWALGRSTDVPAEILSRAQELWDWRSDIAQADRTRANELRGFGAWIRSGQFPSSWWVPKLLATVNVTELGLRLGLGQALATAARDGYSREALELAKALLADRTDFGAYELMRHVPVILAAALDHEDQEVQNTASSLLDKLGREGHLGLAHDVARARSSR